MAKRALLVRLFLAASVTFAASSATVERTQAQQTQCCTSSRMSIVTGAGGWMVQPPSGPTMQATLTNTVHPGWHAPIGTSHWIANVAAASDVTQPSGNYTYTYLFCLCNVPKGLQQPAATMSLSVLADDGFIVYVNSSGPIFQTGNAFQTPSTVNVPSSAFVPGWNTLKIVVVNVGMVTGLDVSGWVAGFFTQCPMSRPGTKPVPPRRSARPGAPPAAKGA